MKIKGYTPVDTIDYSHCEKEPITTSGAIQSYGGLIVVQNGQVIAHSKNIHLFLPIDPNHLLNKKMSEVLPELYQLYKTESSTFAIGRTAFRTVGQWLIGFHKAENEIVTIEFFPQPNHSFDLKGLDEEIDHLGRKFHYPTKNRSEFLNDVCQIFQKYLHFDQIFVQVLHEGEIIEIVAEANNGKIEPVLGLHFSSKEIPRQARELYLKQLIRFKQASQDTPVEIVSGGDVSIDLTHSLLREPSKFMTVYMQNISASTLLSTSLLIDNKLSALLTMHHSTPLFLDPRDFDRVVEVVGKVSLELLRIDDLIKKNADSKLWELLNQDFSLDRVEAITQLMAKPEFKKGLDHAGVVLTKKGKALTSIGECPGGNELGALIQKSSLLSGTTNFTSHLAKDFDLPTSSLGGFAGLMVLRFEDIAVLFFRKSFKSELKWRQALPESFENDTNLPRFSPAGSFQYFLEEFENQSRPWGEKDIAFGKVLAQWMSEDFES